MPLARPSSAEKRPPLCPFYLGRNSGEDVRWKLADFDSECYHFPPLPRGADGIFPTREEATFPNHPRLKDRLIKFFENAHVILTSILTFVRIHHPRHLVLEGHLIEDAEPPFSQPGDSERESAAILFSRAKTAGANGAANFHNGPWHARRIVRATHQNSV